MLNSDKKIFNYNLTYSNYLFHFECPVCGFIRSGNFKITVLGLDIPVRCEKCHSLTDINFNKNKPPFIKSNNH